jgi:NADH pyrophosphatase NudC (nudix superfamily)
VAKDFTLHWWLADYVDGDLRLDEREVAAARWMIAEEIESLEPLGPLNREFFARIFPDVMKR